uniref:Uncharacterized protein n=1 Tax=Neovison vison TaxID=452646 RepID=A0A8C7B4Q8_NEOVI
QTLGNKSHLAKKNMKKSQEICKGKSKEDKATTSQSRGPLRKDSESIRQLMKKKGGWEREGISSRLHAECRASCGD